MPTMKQTIEWITDTLVNGETMTDEEMFLYLNQELDKEVVIMIMRQREDALHNPLQFKLKLRGLNL